MALALAGMAQATAPDAESEIVVIGKRLAALSVIVGRDPQGKFTCALDQSSGNAHLDAQLCRTAAACVRKGASDPTDVSACIDRRKPALLADLRDTLSNSARR